MSSSFIIIIPARLNSTRIKKKMTISLGEYPLIIQTAKQAQKSKAKDVVVATDHQDIYNLCKNNNVNVVMTDVNHKCGTDRVMEAGIKLGLKDDEIIINVQGDEPLINPMLINNLSIFFTDKKTNFATVAGTINDIDDVFNPNIVKVVVDKNDNALYFSRASIPYYRDSYSAQDRAYLPKINIYKHIGIYAYNLHYLRSFNSSPQSELEQIESLEQLRALYNGEKIAVMKTNVQYHYGVDTIEDLHRVKKILLGENNELS